MHLLTQVLSYFDRGVCWLVADREFIGQAWLTLLREQFRWPTPLPCVSAFFCV